MAGRKGRTNGGSKGCTRAGKNTAKTVEKQANQDGLSGFSHLHIHMCNFINGTFYEQTLPVNPWFTEQGGVCT